MGSVLFAKGIRFLLSRRMRFNQLAKLGLFNRVKDEVYLKKKFMLTLNYPLNLDNPQTFNEKIQWLKLYDRRPEYTMMVDKYAVRKYIADTIGEEYLIPLLGVWDGPDEIDFDALPDQFVLKCNHNSGVGLCICKDKSKLDIEKVKNGLRKGLKQDYYLTGREWPYKNVPRKIIAEKYMVDESGVELKDYKFNCFDGEPKFIQVMSGRSKGRTFHVDQFDLDWQPFDIISRIHLPSEHPISKPECLKEMIEIAKLLSKGIPYVRIDLYQVEKKVYFGEITFFPASGLDTDFDFSSDLRIGNMIHLPDIKNENEVDS